MSTTVSGWLNQTTPFQTYQTGCSIDPTCSTTGGLLDWSYTKLSFCGFSKNAANCSKPATPGPGACPVINYQGANYPQNNVWAPTSSALAGTGVLLCEYPLAAFTDGSQAAVDNTQTFVDNFPMPSPTSSGTPNEIQTHNFGEFNKIMPQFCAQPTTGRTDSCLGQPCTFQDLCPQNIVWTIDYTCFNVEPSQSQICSRYRAINKGASENTLCTNWLNTISNIQSTGASTTAKEQTIDLYCNQFLCSPDCLCANRGSLWTNGVYIDNIIFGNIEENAPSSELTSPGTVPCWYVPCAPASGYLLPKPFDSPTSASNCPPQFVCQTIFQTGDISQSSVTDAAANTINCTNQTDNNTGGGGTNNNNNGTTAPVDTQTFWSKYGVWIMILLGVIFVIVFLIIIFALIRKPKPKQGKIEIPPEEQKSLNQ